MRVPPHGGGAAATAVTRRLLAVLLLVVLVACDSSARHAELGLQGSGAGGPAGVGAAPEPLALPGEGGKGQDRGTKSGREQGGAGAAQAQSGGGAGGPAAAVPGSAVGGGASTQSASGGGTGPGAQAPPRQVPYGEGVTDTEIVIGFEVSTGVTELFEAFGYDSGGPPPEEEKIVEAVVKWANDNGGIAGRKIVPVLHATNATNGSFAAQAQAVCATFAEDNRVFAAGSSPLAGSDQLAACMAQRGIPLIAQNLYPFGNQHYRQWYGSLYQSGKMGAERGWNATIDGLAGDDFFRRATIGLVRFDHPHFRYLSNSVIKPRLAKHGYKISEEAAVSTLTTASDAGRMGSEVSNVILRFRQAGVTHVLFADWEGSIGFFFMPQAESQGYRPAYGLSSFNNMIQLSKQAPAEQLSNAVGVSWVPSGDTFRSQYPTGNASANLCAKIIKDAGLDEGYISPAYWTHPHCDTVFFLREALARAPELTPAGLRAAADSLGTDYLSPQSFGTRYGRGRSDGAALWRLARFAPDCGCFAFTGRARSAR